MEFAKRNRNKIVQLYVEEGKSSYQVAEALGTYSTKILRALEYLGIERRDYSEAQITAIDKGRSKHPTKGKKLTEETKEKIGRSRSKAWANISDEERARLSQISKAQWDNKTEGEKEELRRMAMEAIREAGKNGSKTERHLKNFLEENGYKVVFHKKDLANRSGLEVDLFLPELKTAIEVDGPSHFLPIWGAEKLTKQQKSDTIKQGILIDCGYVVLRIRQLDKKLSMTKLSDLSSAVLKELEAIDKKFPEQKNRLIEIEVLNGETKRI